MFNSHVELPEGIWIMNSHRVSQVWGKILPSCHSSVGWKTGWNSPGPNGTTPMELVVEYPSPKVLFCNIPWGWRIILSHPSLAAWNSVLYHTYGHNTTINRLNSPWEKLNLCGFSEPENHTASIHQSSSQIALFIVTRRDPAKEKHLNVLQYVLYTYMYIPTNDKKNKLLNCLLNWQLVCPAFTLNKKRSLHNLSLMLNGGYISTVGKHETSWSTAEAHHHPLLRYPLSMATDCHLGSPWHDVQYL